MPAITSLKISYQASGPLSPNEISKHILSINRRGRILHQLYDFREKPVIEREYLSDKETTDAFFDFLENEISPGGWKDDYSIEVCDGFFWTILVRYSDKSTKKVKGTVQSPPGGEHLEEKILQMVSFKERPLLF